MEERREEAANNIIVSEEFLTKFPPGYRFEPLDQELILDYLKPMMRDQVLPPNLMHQVNIYQHNPDFLTENFKAQGDKIWYYFTTRYKKYKNGNRPNRKAGNGYWKATGADKMIKNEESKVIGYRKALVFYKGSPPKGDKTHWIMHEFRVDGPSQSPSNEEATNNDLDYMKLDYVLCRIYKKEEGQSGKTKSRVAKRGEIIENEDKSSDDLNDPSNINVFSGMNQNIEISYDVPMNMNINNMHSDFQYFHSQQFHFSIKEPSFFGHYDADENFCYVPPPTPLETSINDVALQPMALPQLTHHENLLFEEGL